MAAILESENKSLTSAERQSRRWGAKGESRLDQLWRGSEGLEKFRRGMLIIQSSVHGKGAVNHAKKKQLF